MNLGDLPSWGAWKPDASAIFVRTYGNRKYFGSLAQVSQEGQTLDKVPEIKEHLQAAVVGRNLGKGPELRRLLYAAAAAIIAVEQVSWL
jgi:hypothetical protein